MLNLRAVAYCIAILLVGANAVCHAAAPSNPALEGYANDAGMTAELKEIAQQPQAELTSLARTPAGRDIWLLTLSGDEQQVRPALLIVGSVQASHLLGSELATRVARMLLKRQADAAAGEGPLDKFTFYIIPRPNPDGSEKNFARPWRQVDGNNTKSDDDRDFRYDEDPTDDLNKDGWITMMRVENADGDYLPHPDDDRVMIKADRKKNERGKYRLFTEGRDQDRDESFNEDGAGGVDFNRNFTFRYPYFKPGAGPHAVSEIESRAVADFAFDHPDIAAVFSFSPHDNLLHPWKSKAESERQQIKTNVLSADAPYLEFMAEKYRKIHGGKDAPSNAKPEGAFSEWAYFHFGRWSGSARGWWIPQVAAKKKDAEDKEIKPSDEKRGADDLNRLRWLDAQKIDGFVDWQLFKHPDFPGKRVEIGGFKPHYAVNPPADRLPSLAEKHVDFVEQWLSLFPRLSLETEVQGTGGSVYRVHVRVRNEGYLPTAPKIGEVTAQSYPLQLSLQLPEGATLVHGAKRTTLKRIEGGDTVEHVWLVRRQNKGKLAATVRVFAPSVGSTEQEIELK